MYQRFMFSGLRQNSPLYILEKGDKPILKVGQVIDVSKPKSKYGNLPVYGIADTVVDVSVKVGDVTMNLEKLPSDQSIAYPMNHPNVTVTDSRDVMNSEIEAMLCTSKGIIESVPYHHSVIESCEVILRDLNPQLAREKEQEEKMNELEEKIKGIKSSLGTIEGLLSEALSKGVVTPKKKDNENN